MSKNIAIAVENTPSGEQIVSEHFGRCSSFMIYTVNDENQIEKKVEEPNSLEGGHTSTCQLPPIVKQLGANVVIAGGMGMKAIAQFNNFGIEVITAPGLLPDEALALYLKGEVKGYDPCSEHGH